MTQAPQDEGNGARPLRVGVTGHRDRRDPERVRAAVRERLVGALRGLAGVVGLGILLFLSAAIADRRLAPPTTRPWQRITGLVIGTIGWPLFALELWLGTRLKLWRGRGPVAENRVPDPSD